MPVLITEIEESDNVLNIKAEQYPSGTTKASIQPTAPTNGYTPDFGISAGNTNIPTLFEPPLSLTNGEPQLWLATAGGANWGGCQVWVSLDNVNYSQIGSLNQPSRYGSLYQSLNIGAIIDTASQLFIDVSASTAVINAGSQTDAQNLTTLCYVDGEYLAYANVLLTGVNRYRLSYLVRGAYGSTISIHNTGTSFVRLDDNIFKFSYAKDWIGKQIYIKLLSFNKFGSAMQNLSEVTATTYTLQGANLPAPANFRFEKAWSGEDAMLAWDTVDGAVSYDVQVIAGSPATAKRDIIGLTNPKYTYTVDQMLLDGGAWRTLIFKVRAKSVTGKLSQWVQITADNPQIGALTGLSIDSGFKAAYFKCNRPAENDFAGIIIWVSTTSPVSTVDANKVYDGESNFATLTKLANGTAFDSGITYYLKCAGYDAFGKDNLTISSELSFTVQNITLGANSITQTMITDGAISTPKLAANAVTADKILANTITGDKLLANTITGDKIQANTINSTHIQAGTIQADKLQVGFGANLLDDPAFVNPSFWQFFNINSASHYKFDQYTAGTEPIAIDDPYCKTLVLYRDASPWQSYLIYAQNANLIPVNSNNTYIFSVYVQSYKAVSSISLQSFDINKSFTSSQFSILDSYSSYSNDGGASFTGGKIIENYTRIWIKFKPNAGTKYILTLFNHTPISGSSLNTLLISYFYKPKLEECLVNQALPSPWDAGGSSVIGAGNIKTDKLSAITANLGFINATDGININNKFIVNADGTITIQSAATGQRLVISNSNVSVYDSSGVLRVRMGIW